MTMTQRNEKTQYKFILFSCY